MSSKARGLADLGNAFDDGALSNRNLIINGAMKVAQRGTSFTLNSANAYTLDRWRSQGTYDAEVLTIEQSTDAPDGFYYSQKVTVTTAEATTNVDDYHIITQKFEGQDLAQLNFGASSANTLSFSFWVKASVSQTYAISLYQTNGNKHYSATYTVNAANTWEYKTVSITGNTANGLANDNSSELEIGFMLGAGTTYTSGSNGSWGGTANFAAGASHTFMTTANATFQITGVQLELGDTATPFEHRSYGDELARCQRYYQQVLKANTAFAIGVNYLNTQVHWIVDLPVEMRVKPSAIIASGSNYYIYYVNSGGRNFDDFTFESTASSKRRVEFYDATNPTGTAGQAGMVRGINAAAKVELDAEL